MDKLMDKPCVTLQASGVSLCVQGAELLRDVTFDCCAGEWTLLCGPSGAGKSTLLRLLNGLCRPTNGFVKTLGSLHPGRSGKEAREVWRQCGTVLQEVALFDTKTVRQNVELPLREVGVGRAEARARALEWLHRLGLEDKADAYPGSLSGGQCQRVALARAFAINPRILFLDEPTSALDRDSARVVLDALAEFVKGGATVVMSSHRVDEVIDHCHQVISLDGGRVSDVVHPGPRATPHRPNPEEIRYGYA